MSATSDALTLRKGDSAGLPSPFHAAQEPPPRSWLTRFFRISEPEHARRALTNRLSTVPAGELTAGTISEVLLAFGVRGKGARKVLLDLFGQALRHFLDDEQISDEEAAYLDRLRLVFGITSDEMDVIADELIDPRFEAEVRKAMEDDQVSAVEKSRLEAIRRKLRLDETTAATIYAAIAQERMNEAVAEATADSRLSPTEVQALYDMAAGLGAQLNLTGSSRAAFERMQVLWRIDNGELPVVPAPVNLQRREECHAIVAARWFEMRTRTVRVNYSGVSASIRICKGVRYRVGSITPQRVTRDELVEIDQGTLYITNKRIIFDGSRKNSTIRLSGLLSFTPYTDGVQLEKASGKPVLLQFDGGDAEMIHAILSGAMNADAE